MILCLLVVGFTSLGVTYWNRADDVQFTQLVDTLGGNNVAASTLDSTATFPWMETFSVQVGPGYSSSSFFARTNLQTGYGDSIALRFYLRGWSTKGRDQLLSVTPLWGYAAPYTQFGRPKAHLWSSTTNGQADSTTRILTTNRVNFHMAGPVTSNDSTSYYYANGRTYNYILIPPAPWYDIVMADSAAVTAKGCYAKVTVTGYPE